MNELMVQRGIQALIVQGDISYHNKAMHDALWEEEKLHSVWRGAGRMALTGTEI